MEFKHFYVKDGNVILEKNMTNKNFCLNLEEHDNFRFNVEGVWYHYKHKRKIGNVINYYYFPDKELDIVWS